MKTSTTRAAVRAQLTDTDQDLLRAARACLGVVLGDAAAEAAQDVKALGLAPLVRVQASLPARVRAELSDDDRAKLEQARALISAVLPVTTAAQQRIGRGPMSPVERGWAVAIAKVSPRS